MLQRANGTRSLWRSILRPCNPKKKSLRKPLGVRMQGMKANQDLTQRKSSQKKKLDLHKMVLLQCKNLHPFLEVRLVLDSISNLKPSTPDQ